LSLSNAKKSNTKARTRSEDEAKETITLSIDKSVLDDIRKEATLDGKSTNALVNSILFNWTNFYKYHRESQAVVLTAKNFQAQINNIEEDVVVNEFKDNAINLMPAILAERHIPLTLENLIEYEYRPFGVVGGAFLSVQLYVDDDGHRNIMIRHRHGIKWSRILSKAVPAQLEILFGYHTAVELTPYLVRLKILEKS
jgi:hypothetical protein